MYCVILKNKTYFAFRILHVRNSDFMWDNRLVLNYEKYHLIDACLILFNVRENILDIKAIGLPLDP